MRPEPHAAVLIVSYNSAGDLQRCLTSAAAALQSVPYEICVIDNGSRDGSPALIRREFPSVQLIENSENKGFAAAINQGIRATRAPYLFWMNPDSELAEGSLETLLKYFEDSPKTGILGVKIVNPDGSLQLSARSFPSYATAFFNRYSFLSRLFPNNPLTRSYLGTDWDHNEIHSADWVSGAGLIHRRKLIEEIGFLDETFFMYCEDVDFCLRAARAGWTVSYHPGLTLRHVIGGSSKSIPERMVVERHRSIWNYYKKHFQRNPLKDLAVGLSIFVRCLFLLLYTFLKKTFHAAG